VNHSRIDKLAKKYLPEWFRVPIRFARLRLALKCQSAGSLFRREKTGGVSIPPPMLRYRVQGALVDAQGFLNTGLNCAQNVRSALGMVGKNLGSFEKILSFGCGCGRTLRWFKDLPDDCRIIGTDIDRKAVKWCSRNISCAEFDTNALLPPLGYGDETFDLILSLSVIDHFDAPYQAKWMAELGRVTKPDAIVLVTFFGRTAQESLRDEERELVESRGFLFKEPIKGLFKLDGLPDFYQISYQTRENAVELCSKEFEVKEYIEGGLCNFEDMAVLKKRPKKQPSEK